MKKTILFIVAIFFASQINAQINLVPNPSFEDTLQLKSLNAFKGNCPIDNDSNFILPKYWIYSTQSVDYYNAIDKDIFFTSHVPNNILGYCDDNKNGSAYLGLFARTSNYYPNYREIIGARLLDSLKIGVKYFASIDISLADSSNCGVNNLGMLLTTVPYDSISLHNYSQLFSSTINTNNAGWTTLQFSIVADSNYKYLYVGNFFDNLHTDTSILISNPTWQASSNGFPDNINQCWAYYYLDNIYLGTDSVDAGTKFLNISNLFFYPNPTNKKIFIPSSGNNFCVSLFDFLGRKRKEVINENTVDVTELENGIYIVQYSAENKIFQQKILIHHQ
ncbi:MAG: hypothetical protein RIQ33_605 [Bacteroidota bacterium]|jgi:hypothetical protein